MQLRRMSNFFTATGVIVGTVAILGYAFDLVPALPPSVLKLVIYKLTFIGAFGLVVFGAILGRLARKPKPPELLSEPVPELMKTEAASVKRGAE